MKNKYTIPGYFEDCVISGDEIREDRLFGTVLFRYDNHTLKEPGFFGSTVLVFKNGGIYKPGFFGERLFRVSENGEVREDRLFGKSVGVIPPEWMALHLFLNLGIDKPCFLDILLLDGVDRCRSFFELRTWSRERGASLLCGTVWTPFPGSFFFSFLFSFLY